VGRRFESCPAHERNVLRVASTGENDKLDDWRGETLSSLRALIKEADPEVVEEWKWRKASNPGVPA
jgi:hypothetical protein